MYRTKNTAGRIMLAAVAAVGLMLSSFVSQAQAFSSTEGDVVLAIYGNDTEALINLGNRDSVFPGTGSPTQIDVGAALTAASQGSNPVRFTVFSGNLFNESVLGGSKESSILRDSITVSGQLSITSGWPSFTGDTISASNPASFSSRFARDGGPLAVPFLGGYWLNNMTGVVGDILNVFEAFEGVAGPDYPFTTIVGQVQLLANGQFLFGNISSAPVPVPAAVVLFGSGLVGLAGMARRSFSRAA